MQNHCLTAAITAPSQVGNSKNCQKLLLSSISLVSLITTTNLFIFGSSALAQSIPPPIRVTSDEYGVDIARGMPFVGQDVVSIGVDNDALTHRQIWVDHRWRNNNIGFLVDDGQYITVSIGGRSRTFTFVDGIYASDQGDGATIVPNNIQYIYNEYDEIVQSSGQYILNDADGSVIVFNIPGPDSKLYHYYASSDYLTALIDTVTKANGRRIKFNYQSSLVSTGGPPIEHIRLISVQSNDGYFIKYIYRSNNYQGALSNWTKPASVIALNQSTDFCNPTGNGCNGLSSNAKQAYFTEQVSGNIRHDFITDPSGNVSRYTIDTYSMRLKGIKDPGSTIDRINFDYNAWYGSRISNITTGGYSRSYSWQYDSNDYSWLMISSDGLGRTRVVKSDGGTQGNIFRDENATGQAWSYEYDASGRIFRTIAPEGNYSQFGYDGRGNVIERREVAKPASGLPDIVVTAVYPSDCQNLKTCNKPLSITDPRGNISEYAYDPNHGGLISETLPPAAPGGVRPQTRFTYAQKQAYYRVGGGSVVASGEPITVPTGSSTCQTGAACAGTADEIVEVIDYGPQTVGVANNLLPVSRTVGSGNSALSATTTFAHDYDGNVVAIDGPLAGTNDQAHFRFDRSRQLTGTVSPDPDGTGPLLPRASRFTRNGSGQVVVAEIGNVSDASDAGWAGFTSLQQFTTSYDSLNRPIRSSLSSGGTTYSVNDTSYDVAGRVKCQAQRMDVTQWNAQTDACVPQLTGSKGPDRVRRNTYNTADQIISNEAGVGTTTQIVDMATTFTANGRPATLTDANGNMTTYEYDGHDRIVKTRMPSPSVSGASSTTDYEQLTYDANGNVIQRQLRDGLLHGFTFDNLNRITAVTKPDGFHSPNVANTYDLLGRLTQTVDANGRYINFAFDALGRLTSEVTNFGNTSYQYDAAGRRTRLTWGDTFYVGYDYLLTGEVTHIRENGAMSGAGVLATYTYDGLGQRTKLTRGNGTVTDYGYDPVSRLDELSHDLALSDRDVNFTYSYNPAGQIIERIRNNDAYAWTQHYNVDRPYTTNGLNQYTAAGPVSLSYDGRGNLTTSGSNSFGYSSGNQLIFAPNTQYLYYDTLGRLDHLMQPGFTSWTGFDYDGQALITETQNNTSTILRRYVHGPGVDEPLVWYEGAGTSDRRWLHADERGSIIAVSDGSGTAIRINSYDDYGIPSTTNLGRFQYTGQTWLPELGMYYYKARIYSPTLGRFMQADPIGYGDGMNIYAYVGNDPVNGRDPTGMAEIVVQGKRPVPADPYAPHWASRRGYDRGCDRGIVGYADILDQCQASYAERQERGPEGRSPQSGQCVSPSTSSAEAAAARAGNRNAYWSSRAARGDPLAATALGIVRNNTTSGRIANSFLRNAILRRDGLHNGRVPISTPAVKAEMNQIGVELMRAHMNAVNTFGSPSAEQVAQYHFDVFGDHGIPASTFGGAPLTGSQSEAGLTSGIWMEGC